MADSPNKKQSNPWPLRIVLLVILAVMTGALIYDRMARKWHNAAWERIDKLQNEKNSESGQVTVGAADVREAIGKDSVSGAPEVVDHYYREDYIWRAGLPGKKYFICVIYQKIDDKPILYSAFQGRVPENRDLPMKPLQHEDLLELSKRAAEEAEKRGTDPQGEVEGEVPDDGEPTEEEFIDVGPAEEEKMDVEPTEVEIDDVDATDIEPTGDLTTEIEPADTEVRGDIELKLDEEVDSAPADSEAVEKPAS